VMSVLSSFSNCVRRPMPGGAMHIPFGVFSRNLLFAISSIEGMSGPLSSEMKTIMFLRPLRCSGR